MKEESTSSSATMAILLLEILLRFLKRALGMVQDLGFFLQKN